MIEDFSAVVSKLTAHESELADELKKLSARTKSVADQLAQVQTALAALRGKAPAKATRAAKGARKETIDSKTMELIVCSVLEKHDRLSFDALLGHVKSELLARGLSRVGAKPQLVKVTKSSAVTVNPDQTISVV